MITLEIKRTDFDASHHQAIEEFVTSQNAKLVWLELAQPFSYNQYGNAQPGCMELRQATYDFVRQIKEAR